MSGYLASHTRSSGTCAEVDPELERQLARAADAQPVEAVLLLGGGEPERSRAVAVLIERVCAGEPAGTIETNFLPRLGALIVRACPRVIRRLIAQPEVELACANRPADENSVGRSPAEITET